MQVFVFQAVLVPYAPHVDWSAGPVLRTVAVREDQTLEQLHEALRLSFGWADPHMYAFWMSGRWWDEGSVRYQAPYELDPDDDRVRSGRTALSELGLRKGNALAYLFDFGDEWRLLLKVVERWEAGDRTYPMLVEVEGVPPPQYGGTGRFRRLKSPELPSSALRSRAGGAASPRPDLRRFLR